VALGAMVEINNHITIRRRRPGWTAMSGQDSVAAGRHAGRLFFRKADQQWFREDSHVETLAAEGAPDTSAKAREYANSEAALMEDVTDQDRGSDINTILQDAAAPLSVPADRRSSISQDYSGSRLKTSPSTSRVFSDLFRTGRCFRRVDDRGQWPRPPACSGSCRWRARQKPRPRSTS